jgi:hypothetical protein
MKQVAEQLTNDGYKVQSFDLDTADGLAEGAYHSVMSTPTLLLVDGNDQELAEWRGIVPTPEEVKAKYVVN